MPEKGWKCVTIREGTKEILKKEAIDRKLSINNLIMKALSKLSS